MMRNRSHLLVPVLYLTTLAPAFAADAVEVTIGDLAYAPARITVHVGDIVKFENRDFIDHTATAEGSSFDLEIAAQGSASATMREAGTFRYICRYHPNMTGEIDVTGK